MRAPSSWLAAAAALVGAAWGCSNNVTTSSQATGSGGATMATATTATTATTGSSTSASSTGGGGTGGTGGNDSFSTAQPINVNATLAEDLGAAGKAQYFVFTGKKGEALDIEALAQSIDTASPHPYDPSYIDTVITLYDVNHQQIAENDQVVPPYSDDADLFTVLPADGTYYLRVTDCWGWTAESGKTCALPKTKTHTAYSLQIYEKDASQGNVVMDPLPDPGNGPSSATPMKYQKQSGSMYYRRTDVYGFFDDATDVDVFSFTLPADVPVSKGRLTAYVYAIAAGPGGDGSTEQIGTVSVTDPTGATVLAQIDGAAGGRIDMPAQAGQGYLLFVGRNDGLVGSNDFYVVFHEGGGSNPVEANDMGNGTMAGAEALVVQPPTAQGYVGGYVDGDLTPAGTDVDYYSAAVPPNLPSTATVTASCAAQLYGSGLRGFKLTLLDDKGNPLGTSTETANSYAYVSPVAIPAGAQSLYIRVEAASQDPVVKGTYYACGITYLTQ